MDVRDYEYIVAIADQGSITRAAEQLFITQPALTKFLQRIEKELEKARNGLRIVEQKLSNEKFVSKAPEAVVNAEKEKAAKYSELIAKLEESAKAMQA